MEKLVSAKRKGDRDGSCHQFIDYWLFISIPRAPDGYSTSVKPQTATFCLTVLLLTFEIFWVNFYGYTSWFIWKKDNDYIMCSSVQQKKLEFDV